LDVGRWWTLGDLALFGPRPAEVLELLQTLPGISLLRGNTDRYVLTGLPDVVVGGHPHDPNAEFVASLLTEGRRQR
jgi:hypothetical protein